MSTLIRCRSDDLILFIEIICIAESTMFQLACKFSKLTTSANSYFGISKMFPVSSFHSSSALQFQLSQNNYGGITKKKKKQDPSKS